MNGFSAARQFRFCPEALLDIVGKARSVDACKKLEAAKKFKEDTDGTLDIIPSVVLARKECPFDFVEVAKESRGSRFKTERIALVPISLRVMLLLEH